MLFCGQFGSQQREQRVPNNITYRPVGVVGWAVSRTHGCVDVHVSSLRGRPLIMHKVFIYDIEICIHIQINIS